MTRLLELRWAVKKLKGKQTNKKEASKKTVLVNITSSCLDCKCLWFKFKKIKIHNHLVEGGESSMWHKVSHKTKKLFENYFERKLSPRPAFVEHEKDMWTIFGQDFTFSKK